MNFRVFLETFHISLLLTVFIVQTQRPFTHAWPLSVTSREIINYAICLVHRASHLKFASILFLYRHISFRKILLNTSRFRHLFTANFWIVIITGWHRFLFGDNTPGKKKNMTRFDEIYLQHVIFSAIFYIWSINRNTKEKKCQLVMTERL